jgi:acyl dehydratase
MSKLRVFETSTGFSDEEIAEARSLIGKPLRITQFNSEVTVDAIKHYAAGIGDLNPLWCDAAYSATGPFGGIVAPPTFLYSVFAAGIGPGLPGVQAFFGAGRWDWQRPVHPGETIEATARLIDMYERSGEHVERMIVQVGETIYTSDGDVVGRYESKALRVPRAAAGGGLKYDRRNPYIYSEEELDRIENAVLGWSRRGDNPLYWEDVVEGTVLPELVKGPLDLTTMITYYGGALPMGYAACDTQWRTRHAARTSPESLPNNRPVEWLTEKTWPGMGHFQQEASDAIGMPGPYDNGWMRTSWMSQLVTDWIGDAGKLKSMSAKLVRPNLFGDTLWFKGKVTSKRSDPEATIELELEGVNQLGDVSCTGSATVVLLEK